MVRAEDEFVRDAVDDEGDEAVGRRCADFVRWGFEEGGDCVEEERDFGKGLNGLNGGVNFEAAGHDGEPGRKELGVTSSRAQL